MVSLAHGIECKKRGLAIQCHDEIKFALQDLAARALILSVVRDDPQIYPGRSADVEETEGMYAPTEERGDLAIRNIWKCQTDSGRAHNASRILMHTIGHPTFI